MKNWNFKFLFWNCPAVLIFLTVLTSSAFGQTRFNVNINAEFGFPQGDYQENINKPGIGAGFDFVFFPSSASFGVGASVGFMGIGSESRTEMIYTSLIDFEADIKTSNYVTMWHLLFRAQKRYGIFRPYIDGLFGFNYLYTSTEIREEGKWDEEIRIKNHDDAELSYGGGGGLQINLYERYKKRESEEDSAASFSVLLDMRLRYIKCGETTYLKKGSISKINGETVYNVFKTETDIVTMQIGVSVNF